MLQVPLPETSVQQRLKHRDTGSDEFPFGALGSAGIPNSANCYVIGGLGLWFGFIPL